MHLKHSCFVSACDPWRGTFHIFIDLFWGRVCKTPRWAPQPCAHSACRGGRISLHLFCRLIARFCRHTVPFVSGFFSRVSQKSFVPQHRSGLPSPPLPRRVRAPGSSFALLSLDSISRTHSTAVGRGAPSPSCTALRAPCSFSHGPVCATSALPQFATANNIPVTSHVHGDVPAAGGASSERV